MTGSDQENYDRLYYARNRAKRRQQTRKYALKALYGITVAEYDQMMLDQGGTCAICSRPCPTGRRLAVDHCHETGKVRGLLCSNCNTMLGKAGDSCANLRAAIDYLEKS